MKSGKMKVVFFLKSIICAYNIHIVYIYSYNVMRGAADGGWVWRKAEIISS